MTAKPPVLVRVSRRYAASPERVFDAWLDPPWRGTSSSRPKAAG